MGEARSRRWRSGHRRRRGPDSDRVPLAVFDRLFPRVWPMAVAGGVVMGLLVGGLVMRDYLAVRSVPVERATVIKVDGAFRPSCPHSGQAVETWFHVPDPPPGLPAFFTDVTCDRTGEVGQVVQVMRPSGRELMYGPKVSLAFAVAVGPVTGVGFFLVFLGLFKGRDAMERRWYRRRTTVIHEGSP